MKKPENKKDWEKVLEDHPVIQPNPFKFIYVGDKEFYYDMNHEWDEDAFYDKLEPEDEEESEEERDWWSEAEEMLKSLNAFDRQLMEEHYIHGKSWAQIGRERNQTRQNIYYHKERIFRILRKNST